MSVSTDQAIVFSIIGLTLGLFIFSKIRYDIIAVFSLFLLVAFGVLSPRDAFKGFSDPVVTTVALVLIISHAVSQSGFLDRTMKLFTPILGKPKLQTFLLCSLVAFFSAFINNVGALALFLPFSLFLARQSKRSSSELLMPIAFASLLGGLITLIGTPPNLLVSSLRYKYTGETFRMFDFLPVGLTLSFIGILYLALARRFVPIRKNVEDSADVFKIDDYVIEVVIEEDSPLIQSSVVDFERSTDFRVVILGIIRNNYHRIAPSSRSLLKKGDILIVEADPKDLQTHLKKNKLALSGTQSPHEDLESQEVALAEAIIKEESMLVGSSARDLSLRTYFGVNLLAVQKKGHSSYTRLRDIKLNAGDVIVLQGREDILPEVLRRLACIPLAGRNLAMPNNRKKEFLPALILAGSVLLSVFNVFPIYISFLLAALIIAWLRLLKVGEIYEAIDWPVVVLLAALIPLGTAIENVKGNELIATALAELVRSFPPVYILATVLLSALVITPFLNNGATVLLLAPIAVKLAMQLDLNIDPFLMAVAVGASSDFLSPVGHQSNTLVMGPGGYRFGDYWRLGLPLTILIVLMGTPLIAYFWPLQ